MNSKLDNDWKSNIARAYFAMTWNGPDGNGIVDGLDNIDNLFAIIDATFHEDYKFVRENGLVINEGTVKLKEVLYKLTAPLIRLKMTSFDIMKLTEHSVSFQSTSIAEKKESGERYVQCLRLTYIFQGQKVCRTIVHYHSNYQET